MGIITELFGKGGNYESLKSLESSFNMCRIGVVQSLEKNPN